MKVVVDVENVDGDVIQILKVLVLEMFVEKFSVLVIDVMVFLGLLVIVWGRLEMILLVLLILVQLLVKVVGWVRFRIVVVSVVVSNENFVMRFFVVVESVCW